MSINSVRGTRDIYGDAAKKLRFVDETAWAWSQLFGYQEIQTPIFEASEVFHRTLGETSDVVHKETYTFQDRGGDSLTLRPEGTAGIARAFISEGLAQKLPLKFYYVGPMFRYERPQKGRYRQFYQIGVENLGLESAGADVECISLGFEILQALGLAKKCVLNLNSLGDATSRLAYRNYLVEYFQKYKNDLSADSQMRLEKNPLRILDSKDAKDQQLAKEAKEFSEFLNDESRRFFAEVQSGLTSLSIPFHLNSNLVRGLDYYCHTVFEFVTTELGAQGTVLGGGRYDGLIELMGGPKTPGVGWAAGVDRLMDLLTEKTGSATPRVAVIAADEAGEKACYSCAQKARQAQVPAEIIFGGNMGKKMKKASSQGFDFVFILGQSEVSANQVTVKNLKSGEQKLVSAAEAISMAKKN